MIFEGTVQQTSVNVDINVSAQMRGLLADRRFCRQASAAMCRPQVALGTGDTKTCGLEGLPMRRYRLRRDGMVPLILDAASLVEFSGYVRVGQCHGNQKVTVLVSEADSFFLSLRFLMPEHLKARSQHRVLAITDGKLGQHIQAWCRDVAEIALGPSIYASQSHDPAKIEHLFHTLTHNIFATTRD